MDQSKIGKFIAKCRKEKNMTQGEMAEILGVTDRAIGNWENGRNMPDLSLFEPLCKNLDITINDLLSGKKIENNEKEKTYEENLINTIKYSKEKIEKKNKWIYKIILIFGIIFTVTAFFIFPTESNWNAIYSIIGVLISFTGFYSLNKTKPIISKIIIDTLYLIIFLFTLITLDYINVKLNNTIPRFTYKAEYLNNMMVYKSIFCNVYKINSNTKNKYYIIDSKKEYNEYTVPNIPFNRTKTNFENLIKYKSKNLKNTSNVNTLINNLPLSEYKHNIEINLDTLSLTINYNASIDDNQIEKNNYWEKGIIYNSISIFSLIENVDNITYNFKSSNFKLSISREEIKTYPNFEIVFSNENNYIKYLENYINDLQLFCFKIFEYLYKD